MVAFHCSKLLESFHRADSWIPLRQNLDGTESVQQEKKDDYSQSAENFTSY
jgi:hypothetical protein